MNKVYFNGIECNTYLCYRGVNGTLYGNKLPGNVPGELGHAVELPDGSVQWFSNKMFNMIFGEVKEGTAE